MKKNNCYSVWLMWVILFTGIQQGVAQDLLPGHMHPQVQIQKSKPLKEYTHLPDTISLRISFPETFVHTKSNSILDEFNVLKPILARLHQLKTGASKDTLRIVHIGDSHVRGRIYPRTVGENLVEIFGAVSYVDMGVNGATCLTFTHPGRIDAIVEMNPEFLILSFGTNESHNRRYNSTVHYHQMDELVKLLRARLPGVPMLLTTPPGSYESTRQQRRRIYTINPRTATAVNTINKYARERKLALWDMYTIIGGKDYACKNWQAAGLMRRDHVHYMPEGYVLQGELLFQALINAYNAYVFD